MANACLFIGWNRPYPGTERETYAYLMTEAMDELAGFQKQGFFESLEAVGLTAHGGDLNGFILLKGERAKLDELRRTDEFEHFSMTLASKLDRYGVVPGVTLEGMRQVMQRVKNR